MFCLAFFFFLWQGSTPWQCWASEYWQKAAFLLQMAVGRATILRAVSVKSTFTRKSRGGPFLTAYLPMQRFQDVAVMHGLRTYPGTPAFENGSFPGLPGVLAEWTRLRRRANHEFSWLYNEGLWRRFGRKWVSEQTDLVYIRSGTFSLL